MDPSWTDFGANLAPTWPPKSAQETLFAFFFVRPKFMHFERFPQVAEIDEIAKNKKLLASKCRNKKAGGRRSSPAGESIRRPTLVGRGTACRTHPLSRLIFFLIILHHMLSIFGRSLFTPLYPPRRSAHSASQRQNCIPPPLGNDLKLNLFSTSLFDATCLDFGLQLGPMLETFSRSFAS